MDILHSQAGGVSKHVHHIRIPKHQELFGDIDYVLPNARLFRMRTSLHIFEDNEVVTQQTTMAEIRQCVMYQHTTANG